MNYPEGFDFATLEADMTEAWRATVLDVIATAENAMIVAGFNRIVARDAQLKATSVDETRDLRLDEVLANRALLHARSIRRNAQLFLRSIPEVSN